MARKGAKLAYIKKLRGICPEGYEMQYYKAGGQLCKKCMKKRQDGGPVNKSSVDEFKRRYKISPTTRGKEIHNPNNEKPPYKNTIPNNKSLENGYSANDKNSNNLINKNWTSKKK